MNFTPVLRNAWLATRRHTSWWVMAIVANSLVAGFSIPSFGGSPPAFQPRAGASTVPTFDKLLRGWWLAASPWLASHTALLLLAVVGTLAIAMPIWLWAITAQGAVSWGTMQLARGRQVRGREAWRMGRRLFWRFAGLWLIAFVLGILALAVSSALVFAVLRPSSAGGLYRAYLTAAGSPLLGLWTLVLVPAYIMLAYAKRAIALEDMRVRQALAVGWRMLRRRAGASLLAWIINIAFYFAGLIVIVAAVLALGALLTFLAVLVAVLVAHALPNGVASLSGGFVPYVGLAVAIVLLLTFVAIGGLNVFLSSYWSEVYVRLNRPHYDPTSIAIG